MAELWVVDDDASIRWVLDKAFAREEIEVQSFESAEDAWEAIEAGQRPKAVFTDVRMQGSNGFELASKIREQCPGTSVVIMTAYTDLDAAVGAFEAGAFEYLPKPFDIDAAVELAQRAIKAGGDIKIKPQGSAANSLLGEAPAMQEMFRAIGRLARANITVLITGESGTGKERVAQALHQNSPRASQPFIALNMAAIPRDLLESELFGHERGAFTGANTARVGRFEQAHGGTLFLDEIGDMPAELQTRLLRVLADGQFYRVGAREPTKVDVRILAATHQNLEIRVREGVFREDLFHRLNVIRLHVPALRERREDVGLLMQHFLQQVASELGMPPKSLSNKTVKALQARRWPGNVRELENTARWLSVMVNGDVIEPEDLPDPQSSLAPEMAASWEQALDQWARKALSSGEGRILKEAYPAFERILLTAALEASGGRRIDAAELLGWGRNTVTRKIRELGVEDLY